MSRGLIQKPSTYNTLPRRFSLKLLMVQKSRWPVEVFDRCFCARSGWCKISSINRMGKMHWTLIGWRVGGITIYITTSSSRNSAKIFQLFSSVASWFLTRHVRMCSSTRTIWEVSICDFGCLAVLVTSSFHGWGCWCITPNIFIVAFT